MLRIFFSVSVKGQKGVFNSLKTLSQLIVYQERILQLTNTAAFVMTVSDK